MSRGRSRRRTTAAQLLVVGACWSAAFAASAQTPDLGGGTGADTGVSLSPPGGQLSVPSDASLLQSGPPQPGMQGAGNLLSTMPGTSMRDRIAGALGMQATAPANEPAVQYAPAISLQQGWTNNVLNLPGTAAQSSFFTEISPSIAVNANTLRVQGGLSYAPTAIIYEQVSGQNTIAQNLAGQAHAILLPDLLFLNASAFATQQSIAGGYGPTGTIVQNQANTAQNYGLTLNPYLMQRFGDLGTGEIGGSLSETAQTVPGGTVVAPLPGLPPTMIGNQNVTTTEEHVAVASGDAFGRWLTQAYVSAQQSTGTGVMGSAFQNVASLEQGYALTRTFTALGTIGWNDIHYSGVPPVNINTGMWNVGFQWTPNPDSQITARYGRTDGIDAPFLMASYQPTARTRITASYSVLLSTDQQQMANDLSVASSDPSGNVVNAMTGQSLMAGNNFFGIYEGVYKLTTGAVTGTLMYDRDSFQVAFNYQSQNSLNAAMANQPLFNGSGEFGTLTWAHDLSDAVTGSVFAQYGVQQTSAAGFSQNSTVLVLGAQVAYMISQTLSATLQYSHTANYFSNPVGPSAAYAGYFAPFSVDLVLVGLNKTF